MARFYPQRQVGTKAVPGEKTPLARIAGRALKNAGKSLSYRRATPF